MCPRAASSCDKGLCQHPQVWVPSELPWHVWGRSRARAAGMGSRSKPGQTGCLTGDWDKKQVRQEELEWYRSS